MLSELREKLPLRLRLRDADADAAAGGIGVDLGAAAVDLALGVTAFRLFGDPARMLDGYSAAGCICLHIVATGRVESNRDAAPSGVGVNSSSIRTDVVDADTAARCIGVDEFVRRRCRD